ncbi:MAG TPA: 4-alpha-glucanotransferase [Solirubrobacteraceae bacterium]|nr:4-alpha-glucanotransferase [Solirubrobacteraceae bacterium]
MTSPARSSGVQLHVTSLPGGRLGPEARAFVDWLARAGQSWWQMLPIGPPGRGRSPYRSPSAFAAWRGLLEDPAAPVSAGEIAAFRERHAFWVGDWEAAAGPRAVADQVRFEREWGALRAYGAARGVRLIGDLPIYVARGGVDHRAHPRIFMPGLQAGVPPDAFTDRGQLWGNPLYDWPALRRTGYRWWIERLRRTFELFDLVRLDHFRGFTAAWAVADDAPDARAGHWRRGPGRALFDAARRELGELPMIAEDLGVITPAVVRLREQLRLPGMAVLQFAFDPAEPDTPHWPAHQVECQVSYTGTHDNDTLRGWWASLPAERRALAAEAVRAFPDAQVEWRFIRLAQRSPARLCVVQAQDLLGLGSEARMNHPGRSRGQWRWQLRSGQLTGALADRLRAVSQESGRVAA